jgi:hypothetical protein
MHEKSDITSRSLPGWDHSATFRTRLQPGIEMLQRDNW